VQIGTKAATQFSEEGIGPCQVATGVRGSRSLGFLFGAPRFGMGADYISGGCGTVDSDVTSRTVSKENSRLRWKALGLYFNFVLVYIFVSIFSIKFKNHLNFTLKMHQFGLPKIF